ncbi:MAG: hypothetical protein LAO05_03550 [Acidobacteriia bacterium]|nr:hypothetical protein [Terriglobia bacterium]
MTALHSLWLPILLSSVFVFAVSSLIHMATPWHKGDHRKVPDQDKVMDALRPFGIAPGDYMLPLCSDMKEMRSSEFLAKLKRGPVAMLTVLPNGMMSMARAMTLWFLYLIVVSVFAAYVAGRALPPGARYLSVFRFAGVTAFSAYSLALWQMTIWYRRSLGTTIRATIDGLLFALVTAGTFGWLWPR